MPNTLTIDLHSVEVYSFRAPIKTPVVTSFGSMVDRPAVFVKITDKDGAYGWGEIFSNWPVSGAEHRARLLLEDVTDLLLNQTFTTPKVMFDYLMDAVHIRALQSGEWGPFRNVVAGLDIAVWDLLARKMGTTVRHMINPNAPNSVAAYASGIHIDQAPDLIARARDMGFIRFKVKIGFDMDSDIAKLEKLYTSLKSYECLMVDANQAWTPTETITFSKRTQAIALVWIEEPIRADLPRQQWHDIYNSVKHPIAAGENIAGYDEFNMVIAEGGLNYIQPDIAKWGGLSGCINVAQSILNAGKTYCPHFLGGVVGLIASGHCLAAVGGAGLLEIDVNPNPLRDVLADLSAYIKDGDYMMSNDIGFGFSDPITPIKQYQSYYAEKILV